MSIPPAVECRGVTKAFGSFVALADIDMTVAQGSIHALVGPNGSGKSTCLGIISGRLAPSAGTVELLGEEVTSFEPRAAADAGVHAIYQELSIVEKLSTQANVFLGDPDSRAGLLREETMRRRMLALCERWGIDLPPDVPAGSLSVADRQLLEILRAVHGEPRIIVMDEPTASLAPAERKALFRIIRELRRQGVGVLFVSHNLEEVLDLADEVTVFRDGRVAASGPARGWDKDALIAYMFAATTPAAGPAVEGDRPRERPARGDPVLCVEGLCAGERLRGVGLDVAAGEIVGVAGLVGSGRSTLLRSLGGAETAAEGRLWLDGREIGFPSTPRRAIREGIGLITEDRAGSGVVESTSAAGNVVLTDLRKCARRAMLGRRAVLEAATRATETLDIAPGRLSVPAGQLSGGNQQKLLFGRWIHRPVRVLLADEPMRGIDVGTKRQIADTLRGLARDGMGILIVSSEFEDLPGLCDRVVVMAHGVVVAELDGTNRPITVDEMISASFAASSRPAEAA